jgi:hypothetical protein
MNLLEASQTSGETKESNRAMQPTADRPCAQLLVIMNANCNARASCVVYFTLVADLVSR